MPAQPGEQKDRATSRQTWTPPSQHLQRNRAWTLMVARLMARPASARPIMRSGQHTRSTNSGRRQKGGANWHKVEFVSVYMVGHQNGGECHPAPRVGDSRGRDGAAIKISHYAGHCCACTYRSYMVRMGVMGFENSNKKQEAARNPLVWWLKWYVLYDALYTANACIAHLQRPVPLFICILNSSTLARKYGIYSPNMPLCFTAPGSKSFPQGQVFSSSAVSTAFFPFSSCDFQLRITAVSLLLTGLKWRFLNTVAFHTLIPTIIDNFWNNCGNLCWSHIGKKVLNIILFLLSSNSVHLIL
jgi:hypothetical protein